MPKSRGVEPNYFWFFEFFIYFTKFVAPILVMLYIVCRVVLSRMFENTYGNYFSEKYYIIIKVLLGNGVKVLSTITGTPNNTIKK